MASLDEWRCVVIVNTGADVSLVSARVLGPGVKYLPWSERDGRITEVAQQGVTILGSVVRKVQLDPVWSLTPFLVALGVGFDAILGVDFCMSMASLSTWRSTASFSKRVMASPSPWWATTRDSSMPVLSLMTYRCARVRGRWCGAPASVSGERLCLRGCPRCI